MEIARVLLSPRSSNINITRIYREVPEPL